MKRLGLDVGDKYIGVSQSDPLGMIASPVKTIERKSNKQAIDDIVELIVEMDAREVIVGLPKNMNGDIGEQAKSVLSFADKLKKKLAYSERLAHIRPMLIMWDERLTTVAAHKTLIESGMRREKRKKVVDQLAAMYILQGYLDSLRMNSKDGERDG